MARVGTLFLSDNGEAKAKVRTLQYRLDLTMQPIQGAPADPNATKPTHDVFAMVSGEAVQIGAMWKRKSNAGKIYYGVVIDDPSFDRKLFFTAHRNEEAKPQKGEPVAFDLLWSREDATRNAA